MAKNLTSFKQGEGGRPKGAINKTARQLKEILNTFVSDEIETMPERLERLSDKDRFDVMIKILPYVMPKCQDDTMPVNINGINIPIIHWVYSLKESDDK